MFVVRMAMAAHHEKVAGEHQHDERRIGDARSETEGGKDEDQGDRNEAAENVEQSVFHSVFRAKIEEGMNKWLLIFVGAAIFRNM